MSNSSKRKLKKARAQLHEANNILKTYKARVSGDSASLVQYVQGLAAFGQYALEVMEAQSADRSFLVWEALRAWATMNGMLRVGVNGKLEITHVYKENNDGPVSPKQD